MTAGASAPEILVNEVIEAFQERFLVAIEKIEITKENISFKVPKILRDKQS